MNVVVVAYNLMPVNKDPVRRQIRKIVNYLKSITTFFFYDMHLVAPIAKTFYRQFKKKSSGTQKTELVTVVDFKLQHVQHSLIQGNSNDFLLTSRLPI